MNRLISTRAVAANSLFAALMLSAGHLFAQATPAPSAPPGQVVPDSAATTPPVRQQPRANPGAVAIADEPVRLDSVSMTIFPPMEAEVQTTSVGPQATIVMIPHDDRYQINVQAPRTSNAQLTVSAAADEMIAKLLASVGVTDKASGRIDTYGHVIDRTPNLILDGDRPDRVAERFYVALPQPLGKPDAIRGYTLMKIGADRFVTFELQTTKPHFESVRGIYETVVATARFDDNPNALADRAASIAAGVGAFSRLAAEDYALILQRRNETWERIYRPSITGGSADDVEVGYVRYRCGEGARGELDQSRTPDSWSANDKQRGFLFRMDSRTLVDGQVVDSFGLFFMSLDRNEEAWSVTNALRNGREPVTLTEIGARIANSLTVTIEGTGRRTDSLRPVFEGEGYLSRLEAFIVPQVLVKSGVSSAFAFYTFQSDASTVRLRRDTIEPDPERPDHWRITTAFTESKPPQLSIYDPQGMLVRTDLPDGSVREPIAFEKLVQIWRSKNLPMD